MSAWYSSFSRWFQASPSRGPARTCRPPRGKHHKCHPPAKEKCLRTVSSGIFFTLESVPLSQVSMIAASQRQRVGDTPEAHGRKALPTSSSPARTGTALRSWACAAMCAGYQTEGTARNGSDRPCTHVRACAYAVATSLVTSLEACVLAHSCSSPVHGSSHTPRRVFDLSKLSGINKEARSRSSSDRSNSCHLISPRRQDQVLQATGRRLRCHRRRHTQPHLQSSRCVRQ